MNWLSTLLSSAIAKALKDLGLKIINMIFSAFAAGKVNKEAKKETAKSNESAEKLKEDLKKAGDDVKAQEDAIDDFFNSRR